MWNMLIVVMIQVKNSNYSAVQLQNVGMVIKCKQLLKGTPSILVIPAFKYTI